ncbi:hypothetical protein M422DRAFT_249565 [Sphaerobolus stellatus SS14]|uniref:Uncharacterized protein n=1 Tax=Sphaerobolus stellatus (strain SS14) TaxID=990650 RepID=A0A0C9W524_SPHS4|nr:hypothetical protein M422DRAFT_249565 [Sphaerobolus stellatus SS14]
MSHKHGVTRRAWADELSAPAVEDSELTPGLTAGDLTNPPSPSVDPQQSPGVLTPEHLDEPHAQAYGVQTVPSRVQSPLRVAGPSTTATVGLSPSQLARASGTAHQGSVSPRAQGSGSWQNLGDAPSEHECVSPDAGDTEDEDFIIPVSEIVVSEAMEPTEWVNTVFNWIRTSMNRMSPRMKELFLVPSKKASGKMYQTAMMEPAPGSGAEEHARTTRSCIPGDQYSQPPIALNIHENIPHPAHREQSDDSQPWCGRDVHTRDPRSIDVNALREEIKETISATIKEKLQSDADSVITVSQYIIALDTKAQYWSNLSNKATRCSHRALELQLKLAEEKVNTLLHEKAPEEALLEAVQEAQTIHFQLDQNT